MKSTSNETGAIRVCEDVSAIEDVSTQEKARALISDARELGCIAALQRHKHNVKYLTDPQREKYIDLIDLRATDDVLEIGSSMGQHTRRMAPKCRSLQALEVVKFQAEFCRLWCDEDGLDNVYVTAGGASGHLPFENAAFDVVTSNYVLEWCASRTAGDANAFHRAIISEIWRVLKPGGRVFLSTKNRYAFKYLTGAVDEHLGIRFGSALPRWAQRRLVRPDRLEHPPGFLHSWKELRSHFFAGGFTNVTTIFAFPDARFPAYLGKPDEFDTSKIPNTEKIGWSRRDRALVALPARLRLALASSIVFLAEK